MAETPSTTEAAKPGWQTTEFWVTCVAGGLPWVLESVPPTVKAVVSVVAGGVYALARALTKWGIGRKR